MLQEEVDSHNLSPISLIRFSCNPSKWPEFIENVFTRVHSKQAFDDSNSRMIRLLSTVDGEAKRTVDTMSCVKPTLNSSCSTSNVKELTNTKSSDYNVIVQSPSAE